MKYLKLEKRFRRILEAPWEFLFYNDYDYEANVQFFFSKYYTK